MPTRFEIVLEIALARHMMVLAEDALQSAQEKLDQAVLKGSLKIGSNEIVGGKLMLMNRFVPGITPEEVAALQSNKLWYYNPDGSWYVVCRHPKSGNTSGPIPKKLSDLKDSQKTPLPGKTAEVGTPDGVDPKFLVRTIAKLVGAFKTGLLRPDTYEIGSPTGIISRINPSEDEVLLLKKLGLFTKTAEGHVLNQKRLKELLGAFDDLRKKYYDS